MDDRCERMNGHAVEGAIRCFVLLAALALPAAFYAVRPVSRLEWSVRLLTVLILSVFALMVADWTAASAYLRFLAVAHIAVGAALSFARLRLPHTSTRPQRVERYAWLSLPTALALLIAPALVERFLPDDVPSTPLDSPLAHARSYVLQGGSVAILNQHVDSRAQRRALDVVVLDGWGRRARGWMSSELSDYHAYHQAVLAPCAGRVVAVRASEPDREPGAASIRSRIAGNYVLLQCSRQRVSVLLAHLQARVLVHAGQQVKSGAELGFVGNSGNTTEPHLHIHAVSGYVDSPDAALSLDVDGLALDFAGAGVVERGDRLPPAASRAD
jgi:Peptidase family M23